MTQQRAIEILQSGVNVFLTGEPGAGKTYTINQFKEWLAEHDREYAMTASTGIAATHVEGITIHSWSELKVKRSLTENAIQNILMNEWAVERMTNVDTLIVDEVSMLDAHFIDMLDNILRIVRNNPLPFGGVQIVFVGDFFQLPPVSRVEKVDFAFRSRAWKEANLAVCYLTEQHRQSDPTFLDILSAMRRGNLTEEQKQIIRNCTNTESPGTHLYTHNRVVDYMNDQKLDVLEGQEMSYEARYEGSEYHIEILKKHCPTPAVLRLRVGALVMFTRNKYNDERELIWANGTIGTVVRFDLDRRPVVLTRDGATHTVSQEEWSIEENGKQKATMRQFPLKLAWAITVHKSQGMSLDAATVDLSEAFEFGQGYVAISRVRSLAGLHIVGLNKKAMMMHPEVVEVDAEFRAQSLENEARMPVPSVAQQSLI